uniref:Transmembrane protein 8B n=1 Tax=Pelusios castaneus TaxID=367368 RepID=A0A8C8RNR1_9SAUR
MNMPRSFGALVSVSLEESLPPGAPNDTQQLPAVTPASERCWPIRPTLRNELDTFSVHFYIFFGPNISVPPARPALFVIHLLPVLDSGGVLNLELKLNVSSLRGENGTVFGCLSHEVPLTAGDNASITCETGSLAGFLLSVNSTASLACLRIPYPQTGSWYLSLRLLCLACGRFEPCVNVTAEVYLRTYLSPCIDDCGPYGQCKLLRTSNYLYAACECRAGWSGWGCTDSTEAFSYGFQLLATLLLCLSNLMFVPPVAIAVRSRYLLEASVYVFTMFFSTVSRRRAGRAAGSGVAMERPGLGWAPDPPRRWAQLPAGSAGRGENCRGRWVGTRLAWVTVHGGPPQPGQLGGPSLPGR